MELEEIREKIDEVDDQLLSLFCRRMDLVKSVAEYKIANRMEVFRPEREQAILEKTVEKAEDGYEDYAVDFFRELMRVSRGMQQKLIDEARESGAKA